MSEKTIKIKPAKPDQVLREEARALLNGKIEDSGDDAILDMAIRLAYEEQLPVVFLSENETLTPELAYRLRYLRGLSVRRAESPDTRH